MLQLVNAAGDHSNARSVTEVRIPPSENVRISVACPAAPKALVLQPEGKPLDFDYKDGRVYFTVGRVDIHSVVEFID